MNITKTGNGQQAQETGTEALTVTSFSVLYFTGFGSNV